METASNKIHLRKAKQIWYSVSAGKPGVLKLCEILCRRVECDVTGLLHLFHETDMKVIHINIRSCKVENVNMIICAAGHKIKYLKNAHLDRLMYMSKRACSFWEYE